MPNFDPKSIKSEIDKDYLAVFAWLYRTGQLEMKVAITSKERTMLHQKIGIVTDTEGNSISFSGSNNETPHGWIHNIEQFKVFKSWSPYSKSYFESDKEEFDILWNNLSNKAKVLYIDDAIKDKLIQKMERENRGDINTVVKRIRTEEHTNKLRVKAARGRDAKFLANSNDATETTPQKDDDTQSVDVIQQNVVGKTARELFDYQTDAINHWFDHNYNSIFEMATGTGKTFTSINALKEFREKEGYLRAVVVVPLTTLTIQWQEDIRDIIRDCQLINTSTDKDWRDTLHTLNLSSKLGQMTDYIVITTYKMFSKPEFVEQIEKLGKDHVLVTDEMHNLVTDRGLKAASSSSYAYKLGLSATPTRLWKPEESAIVASLFGDNRFTYDLSRAIENKFLVPYYYHPIPVILDIDEYDEYVRLSREIVRMYVASDPQEKNEALNNKLIARARIKKNAASKLPALESLLSSLQSENKMHHALIYVDNEKFLESLQIMLTRHNIITTKFIGSTPLEERMSIINALRLETISAIVAIKCLDEGVDIPSAQTAFFLSNNTDPREYVQRLGRVLRVDREGAKQHADIYDYLILPPINTEYSDESERTIARNLIKGELIRAKFFENLAINGNESKASISDTIDEYGFYFEENELAYSNKDDY